MTDTRLTQAINLCMASIFAFMLLNNDVSQAASVLLLLLGGVACYRLPAQPMPSVLRHLAWSMVIYFLVFFVTGLINGESIDYFDSRSRWLVFALMLVLLYKVELSAKALLCGVVLGALGGLSVAYYETQWLGKGRANSGLVAINFGNIAWLFAAISLLASMLCTHKKRFGIALFCLFAAAAGFSACILSVTRGSWVALPALLVTSVPLMFRLLSRRQLAVFTLVALAAAAMVGSLLGDRLSARLEQAINNTSAYVSGGSRDTSAGVRIDMWRSGLHCSDGKLSHGQSLEAKRACFGEMVDQGSIPESHNIFGHMHSDFVDSLVFSGLPGLLVFLALHLAFLSVFFHYWRYGHSAMTQTLSISGILTVLSFGAFSLTQSIHHHMVGVSCFGLLSCSLALACHSQVRGHRDSAPDSPPS